MTLRTPVAAVLWEVWRLTRAEAAWKLALPLGLALAALGLVAAFGPAADPAAYQDASDNAAAFALILIVLPHAAGWLSIAKLNGRQPGFPFYLAFTRPVRTVVMVGVPMAYLTLVSTAIYLVSALVLRMASGHAFPLLPVAAWMAALTFVVVAASWATRSALFQLVVLLFAVSRGLVTAMNRLTAVEIPDTYDWPPRLWPTLFAFPLTDYPLIAAIGVVCFAATVAGVARQRCGDDPLRGFGWSAGRGVRDRVGGLLRFPCPTSSATLAQIWFDLRSGGWPLLRDGLAIAGGLLLLSAVSGPVDAALNANPQVPCSIEECFYIRAWPPLLAPVSLAFMLFLGGNAFGVSRKQGRTYLGAFEATRTYGTVQLAALKLLVKCACLLGALAAIGASAWMSLPLLGDAVFIQMWNVPLSSQRSAVDGALAALRGYERLSLAFVAVVGVGIWVAVWAALGALWMRYPQRLRNAVLLVLLYSVALVLLALARQRWDVPVAAILEATSWLAAAAIAFATAYLVWRTFAERLLTVGQASVIVVLTMASAAAWLTTLRAAGLSAGEMPVAGAVWILAPAWLPLTVSLLAPWSYSRIRHA